jgi:hypothetical protein
MDIWPRGMMNHVTPVVCLANSEMLVFIAPTRVVFGPSAAV